MRGFLSDRRTAALVAPDGTVDWWCPGRFDAPAAFFRLLDAGGGALGLGSERAGHQAWAAGPPGALRTVLPTGVEARDALVDGVLVRVLTGLRAGASVVVEVTPGRDWGPPTRVDRFPTGVAFDGLLVRSPSGMTFTLDAGERAVVTAGGDAVPVDEAMRLLDRAARPVLASYDGPYRAEVEHGLAVARLLTYEPTGALVAAPTTSLPEVDGGERNFDERYAWLVDQVAAASTFWRCGLVEEAEAVTDWLVRVLGATALPVPPVLTVTGERLPGETEELTLDGWRRSQPVRVGHDDARGHEVAVWSAMAALSGPAATVELWPVLCRAAAWLADEPDAAEADRAAALAALDRIGRMAQARNPLDLEAVAWRLAAKELDPGPAPPGPPERRNADEQAIVVPAAFDEVAAMADARRWDEAHERMERLLALGGPLGLLPAAADPVHWEPRGNLPHARSHLAAAQAALALAEGPG